MKVLFQLLNKKVNLGIFVVSSILLLYFYYLALTQQVDWAVFVSTNTPQFVTAQIVLSLINALLGAFSLVLIIEVFKRRKEGGKLTVVQTITGLFFSILATGCYVCGTILLPAVSITSSFATLPFAGLEVKVLTILLLIYSIKQLIQSYKGICPIESDLSVRIRFGSSSFVFRIAYLQRVQPIFITIIFVTLIYSLPLFLSSNKSNDISQTKCEEISCTCKNKV